MRWANVYSICLLRSTGSSSIRRTSVDNASIVARLDGDDSGKASLGIIRFVPISSPSRLPSAFSFVDYRYLCRYRFYFYSNQYPAADPVPTYSNNRTVSLGETEGFGKTRLSDRTAPLCYRRKISREPKDWRLHLKEKTKEIPSYNVQIRFKNSSCVNPTH